MNPPNLDTIHDTCRRELHALLADEPDVIARMASVAAVLYHHLPRVSFCGFYRVMTPGVLVVGPYQGPVGCLRITFDRGVCGAAARTRTAQLVPDIHAFPGHIACDPLARAELVVPVLDAAGELLAVLDLDSHTPDAFDEADRDALTRLMQEVFADS
ncbi:MAG: GAF domain-containing protein [Candidatus Eisenbacteria bacterium]|uniref:GAF domain-containing protein n=1 Tax=Eiseniibacteriota bacterium TaxID=2212470 RepID=A0A956LYP2_UNCEI|nr:GAF domain-containing protein [Candidatus Eisenbacteria bacterium]